MAEAKKEMAAAKKEMAADVSWSHRALELYIKQDVETAYAEIGPERMTLLHNALKAAAADCRLPRPGEPGWEEYLAYLQEGIEESFGSLDDPDQVPASPGTTVTMTMVYGDEGFHPRQAR